MWLAKQLQGFYFGYTDVNKNLNSFNFNSVIMELYERELLPELVKWLDRREILAIKGPRQSGKTTLLEMLSTVLDYRGKILLPPG